MTPASWSVRIAFNLRDGGEAHGSNMAARSSSCDVMVMPTSEHSSRDRRSTSLATNEDLVSMLARAWCFTIISRHRRVSISVPSAGW